MPKKQIHVRYIKKDMLTDPVLLERIWSNPDMLQYTETDILRLLKGYNKFLSKTVTTTRDGVNLPQHMGTMMAGTYGLNNEIDVRTTMKIGKKVKYRNYHSDGYGGRIYYMTSTTANKFAIGRFWGFIPCDEMKFNLRDGYRTNWKLYVNVPNAKEAYKLFRKYKNREYAIEDNKGDIEMYDEFDFED